MTDTALLAVLLAAVTGLVAGRTWSAVARRSRQRERAAFRMSPHYTQGLHYLAAGQLEMAISELAKVVRESPDAVEVQLVYGNLLREAGQTERAIQTHQTLLARRDLARSERAHILACLATDFRRAGFLDRATQALSDVLELDPKNIHAMLGLQKLSEEQRQWRDAYAAQTRVSRLRKTDDNLVLGYLQAEMGAECARLGQREAAEQAFRLALSLDRRVFPAYLGLAQLVEVSDSRRAASVLEDAIRAVPERAYLAFEPLARAYARSGEASRFVTLCEGIIRNDPRDWRARVALARQLRDAGENDEALGLILRAVEANPHALLVHLETLRTLRAMGAIEPPADRYLAVAEEAAFYRDPHLCTQCRYRADDMLWRCPHCHEWNTFVEERLAPGGGR